MARLITSGFELNSKTSGIEFDNSSISGDITIVTSPINTGTYAAKIATTTQNSFTIYTPFTTNQNTGVYARTWFYISSTPTLATRILIIYNSTTVQRAAIILTTGNQLQLVNSSTVQVGSNSTTLSTNTWYCVELFVDASISSGTITGRLNGTIFATGAGSASSGWSKVHVGAVSGSSTTTLYFDDIAVNDNTGSFQNSFPGIGQIARLTPNAAGDSNGFATNVGGTGGASNNFTRINEVTPDGTTTYNASSTLNASDLFAVSTITIPTSTTINCVVIGGQFANITGADTTAAFVFQAEKTSGGTISQSSAIIPFSTTMFVNNFNANGSASGHPLVLYNDPDGNPWTPTTLASMQIGYKITATNTNPIAVSGVWALVDYTTTLMPNVSDSTATSEVYSELVPIYYVTPSDSITTAETYIENMTVGISIDPSQSVYLINGVKIV